MNLINATNLSHSFESLLFKDINISLNERESLAILGVSGSGKSTLLANIAGLLKPDCGSVCLLGLEDIYSLESKEKLKLLREKIGIIFQSHYLFRGFSALENLQVSQILSSQELDFDLLKNLGIDHTLNQNSADLSGGQQQRLSIARVLLKKPKIIIADEPTGNLDKKTARSVMESIKEYLDVNNACLVIATHDEEIASACNNILRLT